MSHIILDKSKHGWWKSAVFYQIYPKSFQDTDGDGVGDLRGIISRLDYLQRLGIDGIWLSPVCQSPQVDNGYDISDYCAIDPMFGTLEDMQELIDEAAKRNITIIMDLVLNHCSDQHPWFLEAKKGKDNPYYDYFIWRDANGENPPNDMRATFGGPAWTWVPELGQYYFHQFAPAQPDLNWDNPQMRQDLYKSIRFWVEKGVGGFRLDVIDQIGKVADLKITGNGPRLHEYLREMSEKAFLEEGLVVVGEAWGADVERAKLYSAPDRSEMSMVFQFQHMCMDQEGEKWDFRPLYLPQLKTCMRHWQQGLYDQGWNSLFFNNHDLPRIVSRWGNDKEYRVESAKMLATMLHGMQGTPYVYQGEELGMTNVKLPIEQYVDLEIHNVYAERIAAGYAPEDVMASISPMEAPQGALFLCRLPEKEAFRATPGMLLLDGIQDPGNVGTILRTADALDIPVALLEGCADPYSHKVVRSSMGAVFRTPVQRTTWAEAQQACAQAGIPVAVTALSDRAEDIRSARLNTMAVVIGSEGRGVRQEILENASNELIIPMNSRCESLNAAIAAAIVMWQMRQ